MNNEASRGRKCCLTCQFCTVLSKRRPNSHELDNYFVCVRHAPSPSLGNYDRHVQLQVGNTESTQVNVRHTYWPVVLRNWYCGEYVPSEYPE